MLMVRSVFDYVEWVPARYQVLERVATSFMKLSMKGDKDAANNLDPSIRNEVLLPLSRQRRQQMREYAWWLSRRFEELNPYLQGWLAVCHHICHGQLVAHALSSMDAAEKAVGRGRSYLLAEVYLSLAVLYVAKTSAGGQLILCRVDVFEARRAILDKLYIVLQMAEETRVSKLHLYRNAKLWAWYTEARGARTLINKPPRYAWLAARFNNLGKRCRYHPGLRPSKF